MANTNEKQPEKEFLSRFEAAFITDQSDISDPVPFVTVNGSTFASLGDISFISGVPKSGKSSITGFIIATALMKHKPVGLDSLGIISNYQDGRPIIYIDTEQHPAHTKKRLKTVLKMAKIERQDSNLLKVMNWRTFPQKERYANLIHALDTYKTACLWVIDGITDFVRSANNEEDGNELIGLLMQKASENNAAIILLIHENGANGKLRGHIGSEAERKCGGAISTKKDRDTDVHTIEPKYLRDAKDFTPVIFRYDEELGRMVTADESTTQAHLQALKENAKGTELRRLYETCMGTNASLPRAEFRKRIESQIDPNNEKIQGTRETNASRKIKEMEDGKYIKVLGEGKNQTVESFMSIENPVPYQDDDCPF